MDAMLCSMQTGTQKIVVMRSRSMRVRLGMVTLMAKLIEFYIPEKFRRHAGKPISSEQMGKIIPFSALQKKSAGMKTLRKEPHDVRRNEYATNR